MDGLQREVDTGKSTLTERENEIGQLEGEKRNLHDTVEAQRGSMATLTATLQERESEIK